MWRIGTERKMQQIRGVFYQSEECAFMLHIILLSAHFSQNVKYWYEIRDVLVPIFHTLWGTGTNFSGVKLQSMMFAVRQLYVIETTPHSTCTYTSFAGVPYLGQ